MPNEIGNFFGFCVSADVSEVIKFSMRDGRKTICASGDFHGDNLLFKNEVVNFFLTNSPSSLVEESPKLKAFDPISSIVSALHSLSFSRTKRTKLANSISVFSFSFMVAGLNDF